MKVKFFFTCINCHPPPGPACSDEAGGAYSHLLEDGPKRKYASPLMRPWIMQTCNFKVCCHLGVARTCSMLGRFAGGSASTSVHGGSFVAVLSTRRADLSANDALAHCRPSISVRPRCRGERRLLRPSPDYTTGELLCSSCSRIGSVDAHKPRQFLHRIHGGRHSQYYRK